MCLILTHLLVEEGARRFNCLIVEFRGSLPVRGPQAIAMMMVREGQGWVHTSVGDSRLLDRLRLRILRVESGGDLFGCGFDVG